jgi:hypothetical protein
VYRHVDAAAAAAAAGAAASTASSSAGSAAAAAAAVPPALAEVPDDFGVTVVSGGLTNILVRCTLPGKPPLLVRLFGAHTEEVFLARRVLFFFSFFSFLFSSIAQLRARVHLSR